MKLLYFAIWTSWMSVFYAEVFADNVYCPLSGSAAIYLADWCSSAKRVFIRVSVFLCEHHFCIPPSKWNAIFAIFAVCTAFTVFIAFPIFTVFLLFNVFKTNSDYIIGECNHIFKYNKNIEHHLLFTAFCHWNSF